MSDKKYPCLETMKMADLCPMPKNPRRIDEAGLKRLTKSLHEFGNLQPVVWNARTKHLVSGHQRIKSLVALNKTETEVWCVDLTEKQEKVANLRLNTFDGEWENSMLKDLLLEIDVGDIDMDLTGFDEGELVKLMEQIHPESYDDLDKKNDALAGSEDAEIKIIVPKKHLDAVTDYLSNGEGKSPGEIGRGVMKRIGIKP